MNSENITVPEGNPTTEEEDYVPSEIVERANIVTNNLLSVKSEVK